jgi:hypothetical protein
MSAQELIQKLLEIILMASMSGEPTNVTIVMATPTPAPVASSITSAASPMLDDTPVVTAGIVDIVELDDSLSTPASITILAWVGTPNEARIWVRACARVERFNSVFWRQPIDAGVIAPDWPDATFAIWPRFAIQEIWFAAALEGVQRPDCENIHNFPMAKKYVPAQ